MSYLTLPFFQHLEQARSILIAGAGGGFAIFSGLSLYFGWRELGKRVHLANLSFSPLFSATDCRLSPALREISADTRVGSDYFPELHLAQRLLYLDHILPTRTSREMRHAIEQFRDELSARKPWINLPMLSRAMHVQARQRMFHVKHSLVSA